jgi:hypothetical protein
MIKVLNDSVAIIATNQVRRAVTNSVNDSFRVISGIYQVKPLQSEEYRYSINQEFIAKVAESGMVTAIVNAWQSGAMVRRAVTNSVNDSFRVISGIYQVKPLQSSDHIRVAVTASIRSLSPKSLNPAW